MRSNRNKNSKKRKERNVICRYAEKWSNLYSLETSNISVSGWKMANVSNTSIKAYIDNTEIDSKKINYVERPDVIQSITDVERQNKIQCQVLILVLILVV